jgi:tetratricopeptide (TPR) repeat protein
VLHEEFVTAVADGGGRCRLCVPAAIVKNKAYPQSGRLRVNMGNIYFEQKKYSSAIKMYRMALDQVGGCLATSMEGVAV